MARRHFWQFLVTDEGNPIENAEIRIFKAGTEEPVFVYFGESGGGTNVEPQVRTSRKGYFEFWIADETDSNGYPLNQKFKIAWDAVGVSSGYIDHIDIFSAGIEPVDETDPDQIKNKAVSNWLALQWELHRNHDIVVNGSVHGIDQVQTNNSEGNTSVSPNPSPLHSYTAKNKLVSDELGRRWTDHESSWYDQRNLVSGNINQDLNPNSAVDGPHGIQRVDDTFASTSADRNKLISDNMARQWHRHRTNTSPYDDDHTQYSLVNGNRNYTAGVGYSNGTIVNSIGDDDFITKEFVQGRKSVQTINVGEWGAPVGGIYTKQLHLSGTRTFETKMNVTCWAGNELIIPLNVFYVDSNTVEIEMPVAIAVTVVIMW